MEITPYDSDYDIYKDGIILILQTGCWGAQTKLPEEKIDVSTARTMVAGTKRLVDYDKYLRPIRTNQSRAMRFLKKESVPGFPLTAAYFAPKGSVQYINSRLLEFRARHAQLVESFLPLYPQMKAEAKALLEPDGLFDEADYPQNIEAKFHFSWKMIEMHPPTENNVLSPEMLSAERAKLAQTFADFRADAVTILRSEFAGAVQSLSDALKSGNMRRIKQESLNSLNEWMNRFQRLNINDDQVLAGLVEKMREITNSATAGQLRDNSVFRRSISNSLSQISERVSVLMEDTPRRRIVLAKAANHG